MGGGGKLSEHKPFDKFVAFTLAEVLITLGIIGVVAALTIPSLISRYRGKVAVSRLQKFYSTMQQALTKSELDNGQMSDWTYATLYSQEENTTFFETYLKKYLSVLKYENGYYVNIPIQGVAVYLSDGTAFVLDEKWIAFFPDAKKMEDSGRKAINGKDAFVFNLDSDKKIVPFGIGPTRAYLLTSTSNQSCNMNVPNNVRWGCADLIMSDGWKIADDYPIKF